MSVVIGTRKCDWRLDSSKATHYTLACQESIAGRGWVKRSSFLTDIAADSLPVMALLKLSYAILVNPVTFETINSSSGCLETLLHGKESEKQEEAVHPEASDIGPQTGEDENSSKGSGCEPVAKIDGPQACEQTASGTCCAEEERADLDAACAEEERAALAAAEETT